MKKKLLIAAGIFLLVLLVSGALIGVALADDPGGSKSGAQETFIGKVARILGLQEQQIKDAAKQAQLEMVDDAVKAGKLTEERANAIKERIQKGDFWGPPGISAPNARPKGVDVRHLLQIKALADFLGMKPADLQAELNQGKTLAQIGQEHGKSRDQLKDAILSPLQKRLDEQVANGKLTKEKAEQAKQNASAEVDKLLDRSFTGQQGRSYNVPAIGNEIKAVADFLGMKPADVMSELRQGKTLAQIGQEHGKSRDQLKDAIMSSIQKRLDEAVANGKLTKEQADQYKQKASAEVDKLLDRSFTGRGQPPKRNAPGSSSNG